MDCKRLDIITASYKMLQKHIYEKKDARRRVIKFIPYQVSITATIMVSVLITKSIIDLNDPNM